MRTNILQSPPHRSKPSASIMMITRTRSGHHPQSKKDAVNFMLMLKQTLRREPDKLGAFYKTLDAFQNREIDTSTMAVRVRKLFRGYKDLVLSFNMFLPEGYKLDHREEKELDDPGLLRAIDFVNTINKRFVNHHEAYKSFLDIMKEHGNDSVCAHEEVSVLFRDYPDLILAFECFLPKPKPPEHVKAIGDVSGEGCGPSYRLLREEERVQPSGRTLLDSEVLNDCLVSDVPEKTCSKRPHMDKHQRAMLKCEDEQYELDMLIERGASTMRHIESCLKLDNVLGRRGVVEKQLTVLDLRCIEKLYGELGLDVVDHVKRDLVKTLPTVWMRLEEKVAELMICRSEMNPNWAAVYAGKDKDQDMQDSKDTK